MTQEIAAADGGDASTPDRTPRPAPHGALTQAELDDFRLLPVRAQAIPVLLFHEICAAACTSRDTYGITQTEFERVLLAVKSAGYRTITIANYVKAMRGDWQAVPSRPILVTFDDGRLDGYRGADDVLRTLGERATMYVITGMADQNVATAMRWGEIEAAQASGRWDMQLHAHDGHVGIRVDASPDTGTLAPFYAWRRYDPATSVHPARLESFADWKVRAENDILTGSSRLVAHLGQGPDRALSFAVPFGDYGQAHSNDAAIAPELRSFLDTSFPVWFTQPHSDPDFTTSLARTHEAFRYTVGASTTAATVYAWLAKHATVPQHH